MGILDSRTAGSGNLDNTPATGVYVEAIDDDSRTNFQFDGTAGTGRAYYYVGATSNAAIDVQQVVQHLLGYTNPFSQSGRYHIPRTLPVTHPKCPYLYAHRISSFVGKGSGSASRVAPTPPADPSIGAKPICEYAAYRQYEIGLEFSSRPYPLLADDAFTNSVTGSWVKKDGSTEQFTYSPEFVRNVDWDYTPQDNTVQGQVGTFTMWGVPGKAAGIPFTNPPWMWLPDQLLTIKWYAVPFRYITSPNSYIAPTPNRNWRGRINQNPFMFWPAGSLLYMGYSVTKYTPPTMDIGTYTAYLPAVSGDTLNPDATGPVINYERLCDITLTFLHTNRYQAGSLGADITNKNYVAKGHNLLPLLNDGSFRYATRTPLNPDGTVGTPSVQNPPAWLSFPAEVLFTDPDAGGGPTTAGDN